MPDVEHLWLWVPCPNCGALVGMDCVTIVGVPRDRPHAQRWDLFLAACLGIKPDPQHQAPAMTPRLREQLSPDLAPWQYEQLRAAGLAPASPPAVVEVPRDTLAVLPATTEPRPWSPIEVALFAGQFAHGQRIAFEDVMVRLPGAGAAVPIVTAIHETVAAAHRRHRQAVAGGIPVSPIEITTDPDGWKVHMTQLITRLQEVQNR